MMGIETSSQNAYAWQGTWLSGAFFCQIPLGEVSKSVLSEWARRQLLTSGRATLVNAAAAEITASGLENPEYRPELAWDSLSKSVLAELAEHFIYSMRLSAPIHGSAVADVRVDFELLDSGGFTVLVSIPFQELVEQQERKVAVAYLESFLKICSQFFLSDVFLGGTVGEEVRIENDAAPGALAAQFSDWAFLGRSLAVALGPNIQGAEYSGAEVTRLVDGGVFIKWGDWWSDTRPGLEWTRAIEEAIAELLRRAGPGPQAEQS